MEIKNINEVKNILNEYRDLKKQISRKRTKINSLSKKYDFIKLLQSRDIDDILLEYKILDLLKDVGYSTKHPDKTRDLDGYAKFNNQTIGIEAKNSKNIVEENEMFQGLKYKSRNIQNNIKTDHVIIVWNNSSSNQEFDQFRIDDALNNNYGIITTKELLKGYFKVKNNKISIFTFHKLLMQNGLIKFSNSKIKELE